jgi:hypothetical protein
MTKDKDLLQAPNDVSTVNVAEEYLSTLRKAVGLQIDPNTAEVDWTYAQVLDPYGDGLDLPEERRQVGRDYFARSPGSDLWVWFGDLPDTTRKALWDKSQTMDENLPRLENAPKGPEITGSCQAKK